MTRLAILIVGLLIIALLLAIRPSIPGIFSNATSPVPVDELLKLNPD